MKKEEKPVILIGAAFVIFSIYLMIFAYNRTKSLETNIEYTKAVIYNLSIGMRGNYYLYYDYFVDSIKYQGNGNWYPKSDTLSVSDTIEIVFDKTNHSFSRTVRDFGGKIRIRDYPGESLPVISPDEWKIRQP
jgi:hypothetical protein